MELDEIREILVMPDAPDSLIEKFRVYCGMLLEWNERISLTAIREERQIYIKHFYDSLRLTDLCRSASVHTLADVGAGAGFPGIPLAIMFPGVKVKLVESVAKKCRFIQLVVDALGLKNVEVCNGRVEDPRIMRQVGVVDLLVGRAIFYLPILLELGSQYLEASGRIAAYKSTSRISEELEDSADVLGLCKLQLENKIEYTVEGDERVILVYNKYAAASQPARLLVQLKKMYKRG